MARTKGITQTQKPKETLREQLGRCIEYKHGHICKGANSGKLYAVYNLKQQDERRIPASSVSEVKELIDLHEETTRAPDNPQPRRSGRTKGVRVKQVKEVKEVPYTGLGHGGYSMNPPRDCDYKCKFEGESPWWVNNITCHGTCKVNATCPTFQELIKGQRERIKLLHTEKMSQTCPHCQSTIEFGDDISGHYRCGTKYNRVSQEYERICKPPEAPKPAKKRRNKK